MWRFRSKGDRTVKKLNVLLKILSFFQTVPILYEIESFSKAYNITKSYIFLITVRMRTRTFYLFIKPYP